MLPKYISKLAKDFTIHLTPMKSKSYAPMYLETEDINLETCSFVVKGTPGIFSWVVYGTRQLLEVEPEKKNVNLCGDGPYKYIK